MLERIFLLPTIAWIEVNTTTQSALIHSKGHIGGSEVITVLSGSHAGKRAAQEVTKISRIFFEDTLVRKLKFYRFGSHVTNWEIVHHLSGRIRLHHPLLSRRSAVCAQIERTLTDTVGIEKCSINSLSGNVLIHYREEEIPLEQLLSVLEFSLSSLEGEERVKDEKKIGNFELSTASLALVFALPEVPFIAVPAILYTAFPTFKKAAQALWEKKVKVDILDSIVVAGSLAAQQYAVAAFMVWAVSLADRIQDGTSQSTGKMLSKIFGSQPRFAWLKTATEEKKVAVSDLKQSDVIAVHAGEPIPIDGIVSDGGGLIDQSALTGESQPVEKRKGDKAFSCTTVISGTIFVRVEKTGKDTIAGAIQQIIIDAASHQTKAQSMGEKIADKAVLPTLALGGLGMMTGGPSTALAIVNADFGTGIRVAAPTLLLSHLISLAKKGILVKNGAVLDKLANVDIFLFDKTGTLTSELPEIVDVVSCTKKYSKDEVLQYAACAEQNMSHPIAKAIIAEVIKKKLSLSSPQEGKCHIGLGVEVQVKGKKIQVGSLNYVKGEKISVPDRLAQQIQDVKNDGTGVVCVCIDGKISGFIALKTVPRPDAYKIVQYLKEKGVKQTIIISGDAKEVTASISKDLGVDGFVAEVMPHQKADVVRKYKEQGKVVAMVGDGVNDGPALSLADIAISMKGASGIATDTAHIIFLDGHFEKIHLLFDSAGKFKKGVWQSFHLIAIPNALCIIGALARVWGLGASLVLNNVFNLIATVKALGPLYELQESEQNVNGA